MVKIQLDIPERLNRFIGIQKEVYNVKDKRETILRIIEERLEKEKKKIRLLSKELAREIE